MRPEKDLMESSAALIEEWYPSQRIIGSLHSAQLNPHQQTLIHSWCLTETGESLRYLCERSVGNDPRLNISDG